MARERLDLALVRLSDLEGTGALEIEEAVHDARKRCKEARALSRLVRSATGHESTAFDGLVRDAAGQLSSIRDAHAVLATLDDLRSARGGDGGQGLDQVRAAQATHAEAATRSVRIGDPRIDRSIELLTAARQLISLWHIPPGSSWLEAGIKDTYSVGRSGHRSVRKRPTDKRMHEWRKSVKHLWYQIRLVEAAAPSILGPLIGTLDDLAEALGDDHDLAVLIERLGSDPQRFGGKSSAKRAITAARRQQDDLRVRAVRLGSTLYAESPSAFAARVISYWKTTKRSGPELATGRIADLAADGAPEPKASVSVAPSVSSSEREWSIAAQRSEQGRQHTAVRRVDKTRYLVPHSDDATAVVDELHADLASARLMDVEFTSDARTHAFNPPDCFGRELTDDPSCTNATSDVRGRPPPRH